jgi:hypothetical protein
VRRGKGAERKKINAETRRGGGAEKKREREEGEIVNGRNCETFCPLLLCVFALTLDLCASALNLNLYANFAIEEKHDINLSR